jgi:hypothetical protein
VLALDHLAIWTGAAAALAAQLSELAGLPVLEGYAPEGGVAAWGVRLAGGAFLDIHQAPVAQPKGHVLLGLRGDIGKAEALAAEHGWGIRVVRWRDAGDGSPWSLMSFRRDRGVLSQLFVIDYAAEPEAWASPVFDRPLYRAEGPLEGPVLRRVWLSATDARAAGAAVGGLGFADAGEFVSAFPPHRGRLYRGVAGDLVLVEGGADDVLRFDLSGAGPAVCEAFGERLLAVVGETP